MTAPANEPAAASRDEALADSVRALAGRIEALQADVRRLGGPALPATEVGWAEETGATQPPWLSWVGALEPPVRRRPTVPRLLLESLFIAAVAVAAALAELDALAIALVMAAAWLLVALIEWAASAADRRRGELVPAAVAPGPVAADPSWFVPPVEQTLLETPSDSVTVVARLPPAQVDLDATAER